MLRANSTERTLYTQVGSPTWSAAFGMHIIATERTQKQRRPGARALQQDKGIHMPSLQVGPTMCFLYINYKSALFTFSSK